MIGEKDLTKQGIEAERSDVNKRSTVGRMGQRLRQLYSNRDKHLNEMEDEVVTTIKWTIVIQPIAGLLVGTMSIAVPYTLMLVVLYATIRLIDLTQDVEFLDEMSGRVGWILKGSTLIVGGIGTADVVTPTATLIQGMVLVWAVIWIAAMWTLMLKSMLWDLVKLFARNSPF